MLARLHFHVTKNLFCDLQFVNENDQVRKLQNILIIKGTYNI